MVRYSACVILMLLLSVDASAQLFRSRSRVVLQAAPVCTSTGCNIVQPVLQSPVVQAPIVQAPILQTPFVQQHAVIAQPQVVGIPVPVQYSQPIAQQGSTVYGYQAITNYQNQVDLGSLYNQAARLTDQAQQLAGQAATDFQGLVQAEGQSRADVARILAQGQAAKEALQAISMPQRVVEQRIFSFKVTTQPDGNLKVEEVKSEPDFGLVTPKQSVGNAMSVSNILTEKCVKCHNNTKSMGGLNLLSVITESQQQEILNRVVTDDQSLLMPRSVDNKPGPRLSNQEISALYQALKSN